MAGAANGDELSSLMRTKGEREMDRDGAGSGKGGAHGWRGSPGCPTRGVAGGVAPVAVWAAYVEQGSTITRFE